ncbi:MAG: LysR family transcriptional regulator [Thermoanaerobaculia bacterium]|nr:LysR family transcriptional regulator [Thermoanaerobaculia bacterium]
MVRGPTSRRRRDRRSGALRGRVDRRHLREISQRSQDFAGHGIRRRADPRARRNHRAHPRRRRGRGHADRAAACALGFETDRERPLRARGARAGEPRAQGACAARTLRRCPGKAPKRSAERPAHEGLSLRLVEVFCAVYEERSFSRAGERLQLSQPTISGHVKSLEDFFGTPLFDRRGHGVEPTPAGLHCYQHSQPILGGKHQLLTAMSRFANRLEGSLRLGASTVPGEYLLPAVIGGFHQAHPRIQVELRIRGTREIAQLVAAGEVEMGFVGAAWEEPQLSFEPFATDRMVLVAPDTAAWERPDGRIELAELLRLPIVLRETGSGTRMILEERLRRAGHPIEGLDVVAQLGSTAAIKEAVASGLGAAFVSGISVRGARRSAGLRELAVPQLGRSSAPSTSSVPWPASARR